MQLVVRNDGNIGGTVTIPGSKSHTIRALFFASLAPGTSVIRAPLVSADADSAVNTCRAFGAEISTEDSAFYTVKGFAGKPIIPNNVVDVGNSGTSMYFALSTASLIDGYSVLTGDYQICRRPVDLLQDALNSLGATVFTTRNNGKPPVVVKGRANGGHISLDATLSQYISSLLIHAPLFENDTHIDLVAVKEIPYIEMTLWWMDKFGIRYENNNFKQMHIYGGQSYKSFDETIPGDFSSSAFFASLAAISGGEIFMKNLDMTDVQGDKGVLSLLEQMGAKVAVKPGGILVKGDSLHGIEMDLSAMPDSICALAVAGCFAEGETRIVNVAQARLKETDRIAVMVQELKKMGADIEERPDGLVVRKSKLHGANVLSHGDHRVAMSLAVAGLNSDGETVIEEADAMSVTFPDFPKLIKTCGGNISLI